MTGSRCDAADRRWLRTRKTSSVEIGTTSASREGFLGAREEYDQSPDEKANNQRASSVTMFVRAARSEWKEKLLQSSRQVVWRLRFALFSELSRAWHRPSVSATSRSD